MLNAVGMAEKAHNAGLSAGFAYGGRLSDDAKDALRAGGFAALNAKGRLPEKHLLFAADGVRALSGAILPAVDQIFETMRQEAEAAEKKAAAERRYKRAGDRFSRR
ncbi:MAG: hypothetical protein SGJ09_05405 [Phycisphaerae bacterium]|nr:hypothetical protein [Phycisphaerae bacterium]